jgi:hypothetical protein
VDKDQRTPLHWAAIQGHIDVARLLIEKGADPNGRDKYQATSLHWATMRGHADMARLLIEKGADPNTTDNEQCTPLHRAGEHGHTELATLLTTAGRWRAFVKPSLGVDGKLDVTQLVDQAGQPTEALKNLLPNDLFADLARPDFYRQGMEGLVQVFPFLSPEIQASIDLTEYRRAKVQEANAPSGQEKGFTRYVRPPRAPSSDVTP